MNARTSQKQPGASPIIRFRVMVAVIAVGALISAPALCIVWKQSFISGSSVRLEAMSDTLSAQNKQIAALRLVGERLSSTGRIEEFARAALQLEYPASDRIVLLPFDKKQRTRAFPAEPGALLAAVQAPAAKGGR